MKIRVDSPAPSHCSVLLLMAAWCWVGCIRGQPADQIGTDNAPDAGTNHVDCGVSNDPRTGAYHVAPDGDDAAGTGSLDRPFRTIARGLSVLNAGDTLYLLSGTYAEPIDTNVIRLPSGTSWSNAVTIAAYPGHVPVLTCAAACETFVNIATNDLNPVIEYVIFDGLVFDGSNVVGNSMMGIGFSDGNHPRAANLRFTNCELVNLPGGYAVQSGGNGMQFINNKIHDSFPSGQHDGGTTCGQDICWGYPFYWGGSDGLIDGNEIWNFPSWGIHMYAQGDAPSNNIVRNNKIYRFATNYWPTPPPGAAGPGDERGTGILMTSGSNNVAYNNVVHAGSIAITLGGSNNAAYNNTLHDMNVYALTTETGSNAIFRNNILFGNNTNVYPVLGDNAAWSNNLCDQDGAGCTIVGDPQVVSAGSSFQLTDGSSAIDTGMDLSSEGIATDIEGRARPQGAGFEIGAYEYGEDPPDRCNPSRSEQRHIFDR